MKFFDLAPIIWVSFDIVKTLRRLDKELGNIKQLSVFRYSDLKRGMLKEHERSVRNWDAKWIFSYEMANRPIRAPVIAQSFYKSIFTYPRYLKLWRWVSLWYIEEQITPFLGCTLHCLMLRLNQRKDKEKVFDKPRATVRVLRKVHRGADKPFSWLYAPLFIVTFEWNDK